MMRPKSHPRDSSEDTKSTSTGGRLKKKLPISSSSGSTNMQSQEMGKSLELDFKSSRKTRIVAAKSMQPKKSLIRNCNSKPEAVSIMKPCEISTHHMPPKVVSAATKATERAGSLHAPSQVTTLKTMKEIRRVSELDLAEAYKCVEGLSLTDNIDKKVARAVLNVPTDMHVYSDLVSVDVAEHQLGPRITEIRKHRSRDRRDHNPQLSDFLYPDSKEVDDIWPSFSPISIPFDPIVMYDGKAVAQKIFKWHKKSEQTLKFLVSE